MLKLQKIKNLKKILMKNYIFQNPEIKYFIPKKKLYFNPITKKIQIYKYEKNKEEITKNLFKKISPIILNTILIKSHISKIKKLFF